MHAANMGGLLSKMLTADYFHQWLAQGWHVLIFPVVAITCFTYAVIQFVIDIRNKAALPRLLVTQGCVNKIETTQFAQTRSLTKRSEVVVDVSYAVAGKEFTCRRMCMLGSGYRIGNRHADVNFPAGSGVGVYYDP